MEKVLAPAAEAAKYRQLVDSLVRIYVNRPSCLATYKNEFIREGLVTYEDFYDSICACIGEKAFEEQNVHFDNIGTILYRFEAVEFLGIKCEVSGGRKYQGKAILLNTHREEYGYNSVYRFANVLTPEGKIERVTARWIHFDPSIIEETYKARRAKMTHEDCVKWFVGEDSNYPTLANLFPLLEGEELTNAQYILKNLADERNRKHNDWVSKHRKGLLEWVRKTFEGKSDDELIRIFDRIANKKGYVYTDNVQ